MSDAERTGARRTGGAWLAIAGTALSFGGAVTYFTVFARFPGLRDVPWLNLPIVVGGLAVAAWGAWRTLREGRMPSRIVAGLSLAAAALVAAAFVAYVSWLSYDVPPPSDTATTLAIAPEVALTAPDGSAVRIGDFRGRKLVVVFYRGFW